MYIYIYTCRETPRQVFSCEISQFFNNIFFTEQLWWPFLKTVINGNTNFFEKSAVLRSGRDHTWRGLVS